MGSVPLAGLSGLDRLDRELDSLRENMSIAMIPRTTTPDAAAIERVPGCLRVRHVFDDWHAVVEGAPEEATERLRAALGVNGIRCVHAPLEELFIELVGGER